MSLSIEIKGTDEVTKKFKNLGEKDLADATKKWLTESAILLQGESKKLVNVDNGLLRKSIKYSVYKDYSVVYTNLFYAPFVHEGTAPHIILPRFKKMLHWVDRKTGEDRFASVVHHPGYKGNPFFAKAVENNQSRIVLRFYDIINQYIDD